MQTLRDALIAALKARDLRPQLWEAPRRMRIYIHPRLGRRMAKHGKVFFEYPDLEDQAGALKAADPSIPLTTGTRLRIHHPMPNVQHWARKELAALFEALAKTPAA